MAPEVEPLVVVATADSAALLEVTALLSERCRVASAGDAGQLAAALSAERPALLLLDPAVEADGGERLFAEHSGLPFALLARRDTERAGETAVHRGAFDYLTWPIDPNRLRVILAHAVERFRLLELIRRLEGQTPAVDGADGELRAIDRMEKRAIVDALYRAEGNVRAAARSLGLGQATVYRKIKRYKIALTMRGRSPAGNQSVMGSSPNPARSVG
jgi:two-component system NtrC family response regulator